MIEVVHSFESDGDLWEIRQDGSVWCHSGGIPDEQSIHSITDLDHHTVIFDMGKEIGNLATKRKLDLEAMAQMKRDNDLLKKVLARAGAFIEDPSGWKKEGLNDAIDAYEGRDK